MISAVDAVAGLPQVLIAGVPEGSDAPEWVNASICPCGVVFVPTLESPHAHSRHCVGFLSYQHDALPRTNPTDYGQTTPDTQP